MIFLVIPVIKVVTISHCSLRAWIIWCRVCVLIAPFLQTTWDCSLSFHTHFIMFVSFLYHSSSRLLLVFLDKIASRQWKWLRSYSSITLPRTLKMMKPLLEREKKGRMKGNDVFIYCLWSNDFNLKENMCEKS